MIPALTHLGGDSAAPHPRDGRVGRVGREVEGRRRDGSRFAMDIAISEALVGGRRLSVAIVRDITERKRAEEALEAAKGEAERSSRVKSEFLANMSHELRTPMNSIMGFTQRLIRKLGGTIQEREMDALRTVDRNAKHLLGLINNILDLSKIEAGKMELQKVRLDLAAAVREVAEQGASLVDGKPVEVVLEIPDEPIDLDGDRVALKQVVLNLLSNGIKYTDRGTVTIKLGVARDDQLGQVARIAFLDTGVGIKPEDRGRLFKQFTQLDGSPTRKVGGTGLGLVITDQYVRMHGGRIDVSSEYSRGSEFAVLLPLQIGPPIPETRELPPATATVTPAPPATAETDLPSRDASTAPGVMILCVDDEPDILKYLQLTFQDAGYEVALAEDHDGALRGARHRRPDLICLDLNMPGRNGFDVMKSLREDPELANIPVLVVSASSEKQRALSAGASSFLTKPVHADTLVAAVRGLLGSKVGSVLIVEDNPDTTELLSSTLAEHGMRVRTASNGREGLDRLSEELPTAIVLDLMMPVMDGFAFLEQFRLGPDWSGVSVIIHSAKILEPEELVRLGRSVAAILTKGGDDTMSVIDAVFKASPPRLRRPLEVVT